MSLIERRRGRSGSVLMETVLVLPVLFLFIVGILQFAHIWMAKQMTAYAAYAAARAMMVVPPSEQQAAAENAARMVLSWISLADEGDSKPGVSVPGWGKIYGSSSVWKRVEVFANNTPTTVSAKVEFKFPLMMPGMAINRIIANAVEGNSSPPEAEGAVDFWDDWSKAAGNPQLIDGWPYIVLGMDEWCSLPMPYSTADFPIDAFRGASLTDGQ